jgi:hypothetical protein
MDSANSSWDNIVRLHGLPSTIILDKDAKFTSLFWTTLFDCFGTKLAMSSAHHPQMDGQSEVMVRTLKDMLRHFINQNQDNWAIQLPALEFAYNSSVHPITGYTPFELDLGYRLWQPHQINDTNAMQVQGVEEFIEQQATTMAIAQGQFLMAQQTQALNCKGPQPFKEGEKVLISTKYIHPSFLQTPESKKLEDYWVGLFTIVAEISPTIYQLVFPEHIKSHPIINLEYLKAY